MTGECIKATLIKVVLIKAALRTTEGERMEKGEREGGRIFPYSAEGL